MNLATTILARATERLAQADIASARLDARLLLMHLLGLTREETAALNDKLLNDKEYAAYEALLARRLAHEPIAYITGKKEFWSLDFCVTRDTLIPRPDSETLVEAALKRAPKQGQIEGQAKPITLLDIGTGTGCLLIALLKELPSAQGMGVDTNERALHVAYANAKRHGVAGRASFIRGHWCDAIYGTFDLILSNPPYIAESDMATLMPDVARYEPRAALAAGADGLDAYRALAPQAAALLAPGGHVLFEVGKGQSDAVMALLAAEGLRIEAAEKDLGGVTRCVIARKDVTAS